MRLYTEEEVIKSIELARLTLNNGSGLSLSTIFNDLTPIELPSDDEMRKMAKRICNGHQHAMRYNEMLICCFNMGKSVRDTIQGVSHE